MWWGPGVAEVSPPPFQASVSPPLLGSPFPHGRAPRAPPKGRPAGRSFGCVGFPPRAKWNGVPFCPVVSRPGWSRFSSRPADAGKSEYRPGGGGPVSFARWGNMGRVLGGKVGGPWSGLPGPPGGLPMGLPPRGLVGNVYRRPASRYPPAYADQTNPESCVSGSSFANLPGLRSFCPKIKLLLKLFKIVCRLFCFSNTPLRRGDT